MVQLKISSGPMAGVIHDVRHFPFHVGRSPRSDLRLEAPGVWDDHMTLELDSVQGFILTAHGEALATVNGWPIQSAILRNGDSIELGSLKLRFWIGEARQSSLRLQESAVWLALIAITALEIGLLLRLLR